MKALRALTAPVCTQRTRVHREGQENAMMTREPEDMSKAMRADLPRSGKQYLTNERQDVNPQPW